METVTTVTSSLQSSDEEQSDEKDMFVAQLFKFMDERGTPINRAPMVGSRELDVYRLYRIVANMGGYYRVSQQSKWALVAVRIGLPHSNNSTNLVKAAYKRSVAIRVFTLFHPLSIHFVD